MFTQQMNVTKKNIMEIVLNVSTNVLQIAEGGEIEALNLI
jgi:hypothetical protein